MCVPLTGFLARHSQTKVCHCRSADGSPRGSFEANPTSPKLGVVLAYDPVDECEHISELSASRRMNFNVKYRLAVVFDFQKLPQFSYARQFKVAQHSRSRIKTFVDGGSVIGKSQLLLVEMAVFEVKGIIGH
jgi:hypothetical protein